ncbi:type II toxin-antitoxin system VapC family toxin [Entomohabitans teleogrylli]|nr:type II toxin-antitoxin system VapC family toxin [Entomohabitans teleogrylli]
MRLPEAITLAAAQVYNRLLITRNTQDIFGIPGVVMPYTLA